MPIRVARVGILPRVATLAGTAATALLATVYGPVSVAAAAPPSIDMADVFLVEQDGGWFCTAGGQANNATCPKYHTSQQAAQDLLAALGNQTRPDLYLRVAKARNDCGYSLDPRASCSTGVPPKPCATDAYFATPACALDALSALDVKLGIVIGALGENRKLRRVRDVTWHACQVSRDDIGHLYDFVFLDLAFHLGDKLRRTVELIRAGRYTNGGKEMPCPDAAVGHPVITNDTSWKPGRADNAPLDTGAWAHAKRLTLLDHNIKSIRRAASGAADRALSSEDRAFVKAVRAQDSIAVLRLEVPSQSSRFARLQPQLQCSLLARWASLQSSRGYTFIHPLYVHGAAPGKPKQQPKTTPYDSFVEGTFFRQLALIDQYPSDAALPPALCGSRDADIPCGTVVVSTQDNGRLRLQITKTARAEPAPADPTSHPRPEPLSCGSARKVIRAYWQTAPDAVVSPPTPACSQAPDSLSTTCNVGKYSWLCSQPLATYYTSCMIGNRIGWTVVGQP